MATVLFFNYVGFYIKSNAINGTDTQCNSDISQKVFSTLSGENMGSLICIKDLYDSNENLVAYCGETENGYVIYDVNGEIIEYSPSNESPYKNIDGHLYYSGLFGYYVENEQKYENICDGTISDTVCFSHITGDNISDVLTSENYVANSSVINNTINYEPRKINYNENGLNACGTMATTIIFLYYYDHISHAFANPLLSTTPYYMFETLRQKIEPDNNGTTWQQLHSGICNNFKSVTTLKELNINVYNNNNVSTVDVYKSLIEYSKIPCWLLTLTNVYGPHWVVGYGYKKIITSTSEYKFFIVNDGQCRNDVHINENDVSYMMYVKSYKTIS